MDWATIGQAVLSGGLQAAGSYLSSQAQQGASKKAYKRAKEFAQSGIQWKVADATAAGINPYFALGAPTATYSDASVGVDPVGGALDAMGQNIGRAALSMQPTETKASAAMQGLALERAGLENDYLRSKIASENRLLLQPGTAPGINNVTTIPGTNIGVPVAEPGKAQAVENNYGDVLQNILGMAAAARDVMNYTYNPRYDVSVPGNFWSGYLPKGSGARAVYEYFGGR